MEPGLFRIYTDSISTSRPPGHPSRCTTLAGGYDGRPVGQGLRVCERLATHQEPRLHGALALDLDLAAGLSSLWLSTRHR
jgi:hypothetical protein